MTYGPDGCALRGVLPDANGVSRRSALTPVLKDMQVQVEFPVP
jgi:hypothetical protein